MTIFGGISRQSKGAPSPKPSPSDDWKTFATGEVTVHTESGSYATHVEECIGITILGYVVPQGGQICLSLHEIASSVLHSYRQDGNLAAIDWDGSYTLIVCDKSADQVTVYRNLGDTHHTYYCESSLGCFFGDNPLELARRAGIELRSNDDVLPIYFLYRFVPGRETLYRGIRRLLPGEQLTCNSKGLHVCQKATLGRLSEAPSTTASPVDQVDDIFGRVISDYARLDPVSSVLLSGGVDSTYIQAHWNRAGGKNGPSNSFAITTGHSIGRAERKYARDAAQLLHTNHCEVPASASYAEYLVAAISAAGEPPNHVQSSYFLLLSSAMQKGGIATALCGQGADAIFGSPWSDSVYRAQWVRRIPMMWMRSLLLLSAKVSRRVYWVDAIKLASRLDDFSWPDHPVNRHDTFGDWRAVDKCFGKDALVGALRYRLGELDRQDISRDVLRQVNEIGLLGDTYDTCSLWSTLFRANGVRLLFPFLDTRVLRAAMQLSPSERFPYRSPKRVIKQALCRHVPETFVNRRKLSFAQPIYSWLSPGGELRPLVDQIDDYDFVDKSMLSEARVKPNSFLYCLLCYDLWHKICIRSMSQEDLVNTTQRTT